MNKLYRSQRDKKIFGLCGGLAEHFNVDPTLLRIVVVGGTVFSGGFPIIITYVIASLVIPKEPVIHDPRFFQTPPPPPPPPYPPGGMGYGVPRGMNPNPHAHTHPHSVPNGYADPTKPNLDEMMKDIEKKAMMKEIEELRARLAKYEKGDK